MANVKRESWDAGAIGHVQHVRIGRVLIFEFKRWQAWPDFHSDGALYSVRWGYWTLGWWNG